MSNVLNDTLDRIMHRVKGALAAEQRDLHDKRVRDSGGPNDSLRQGMICGIDSAILIVEREFKKSMLNGSAGKN